MSNWHYPYCDDHIGSHTHTISNSKRPKKYLCRQSDSLLRTYHRISCRRKYHATTIFHLARNHPPPRKPVTEVFMMVVTEQLLKIKYLPMSNDAVISCPVQCSFAGRFLLQFAVLVVVGVPSPTAYECRLSSLCTFCWLMDTTRRSAISRFAS